MAASAPVIEPASARLVSLDVFRGATMAFMVLVNNAGDGRHVYAPLEHAEWNGWTPTDVVFPSFVWIAGVALALSLGKRLELGMSRVALLGQVLRRAVILYVLGLIVYAAPDFNPSTQRLLGVLQRIAICYFAAAAIFLTTKLRGQIAWIAGLLVAYWLLMSYAPVPGHGSGRLDVDGNFAHYVDRVILGPHNYHSTKTWDPEGIVSTLPAIATALFGVLCAHLLRLKHTLSRRVIVLAGSGLALILAGLICDIWMPINKKLWSDSFALFMAGIDFVLFAAALWLIDGRGYKRAMLPFVAIGMNPITIYMASELLSEALDFTGWHRAIYNRLFVPLASPVNASLLWALAFTALMSILAWVMYRRHWVIKV